MQTNGKGAKGISDISLILNAEFPCGWFTSENYWLLSVPAGAGDTFSVPSERQEKGVFQGAELPKCISEISKLLKLLIHHWLPGLFCSDLGP